MNLAPGTNGWSSRNVLVTGATGIIGSRLVHALLDRGATVFCLVCEHDTHAALRQAGDDRRARLVDGRLERFEDVKAAVIGREVDTVFHLGAQTIVGTARRDPLGTFETNVRGTYHVLEACRMASDLVRRVIVASSDKAYGECETLPYTERTPLAGRYPYDVSKACTDLLAQSYSATYALPVGIARCGNVFGPGDLNWSRLVPGTIRSLLAGERPRVRSDGTPLRDYLYVDDVVRGYLSLAAWLDRAQDAGATDRSFNFGAEQPLTVLEMVRLVAAAAGRADLEPVVEATATGEIAAQCLDSAAARRELGWATVFPLDLALARTVAWYREYLSDQERAGSAAADAQDLMPAGAGTGR